MKRSWLIAGAIVGCLGGAAAGACGGSSGSGGAGGGTGGTTSTTSSSKSTGTGTGTTSTGTGTGTTTSTGTGAGGAGGGSCKPQSDLMLHPSSPDAGTKTIYCPFSAVDGGKNVYCDKTSEHCCEPKMGTATCDSLNTPCGPTDMDWQCEGKDDCGANEDCCSNPEAVFKLGGTQNGVVCQNYASLMKQTKCVPQGTCAAILMCNADSQCPMGKTCTPFAKAGNQVGSCQ
jgi:hypothetical protein